MDVELNDYQRGVLTGLAVQAHNQAGRDGRTGLWVDALVSILAAFDKAENLAEWKIPPTGGEPFGTKVTYWSVNWGNRHAIITGSPGLPAERGRFESGDYTIVIKDGGMTHVPAEMLTLGWHPEAVD